jgi:HAD superfamily hydrolase (TIGR01509 family)
LSRLAARPVVLLDAGGTLLTIDFARVRRLVREIPRSVTDDAIDAAEGWAREWASRAARDGRRGRVLWDGYFGRILAALRVPRGVVECALEDLWQANRELGLWRRAIPGARQALVALKGSGRRLAVISNAEGQVAEDLAAAGFDGLFETIVDSHLVGVAKPDPRIFQIALERLGATPDDAFYVGDVPAFDLDGAAAAGMPAVLVDPHHLHEDVAAEHRIAAVSELPSLLGC